jgi:hypothetical protein
LLKTNPNNIENWEEEQLSSKTSRLVSEAFKPSEDYEGEDEDRFDYDYNK